MHSRFMTINITTSKTNTDLIDLVKEEITDRNNYAIFKMSMSIDKDCVCVINGKDELQLTAKYGFEISVEDPIIRSFVIKESGVKIYAIIGY